MVSHFIIQFRSLRKRMEHLMSSRAYNRWFYIVPPLHSVYFQVLLESVPNKNKLALNVSRKLSRPDPSLYLFHWKRS